VCSICFNTEHLTSENAAAVDPGLGDPGTYSSDYINGLVWGGGWSGGPVYYTIDQGTYGGGGWTALEVTAIQNAISAYNNVCGINLTYVSPESTDADIAFISVPNSILPGAYGMHEVPDGTVNEMPLFGLYNYDLFSLDTDSFDIGGFDYVILIHELGHGLGLAHPHDEGGASTVFPGVESPFRDYGDNNQNQGIFTTMSYNDGWQTQYPSHSDIGYGYQGTPMAFDIAALQILYGANNSYNTGNNAYYLPTVNGQNQNTYWSCIWDAGGTDTISNAGSSINCTINLNAAPLTGANAGGYVSWNSNIVGGFTIANGVVIENASGGSGNDTLNGNSSNNTLDGGAGNDKLYGGVGDDTYVLDTAKDKVTESASEGTDTIQSSATIKVLAANVENLTLTGSSAINGTGNALANTITANSGKNTLNGGVGNDTLNGGLGNDKLYGDADNDTLDGQDGDDKLYGGVGDDTLSGGTGKDTLYGDANNDTLDGQAGTDKLYGGVGDDTLSGGDGNDTLYGDANNDTLDGQAGTDKLYGGLGDDTYILDSTSDVVTETASEGTDTIQSSATIKVLAANVENLTLTGSSAINGTGNSLANTITGNLGNNILNGGAGNDTLTGGTGLDIFLFDTALGASNVDTLTDFNLTQDKIRLDDDIFSALSSIGAENFVSAAGATALDNNDFLIFNTTNNFLYYDADGSGAGAMVHFATLNVDITSHTSFELIA